MSLKQAVKNIQALVNFECKQGGGLDRTVEVSLDDLIEVTSWFEDVYDNDHVNVASFMKGEMK